MIISFAAILSISFQLLGGHITYHRHLYVCSKCFRFMLFFVPSIWHAYTHKTIFESTLNPGHLLWIAKLSLIANVTIFSFSLCFPFGISLHSLKCGYLTWAIDKIELNFKFKYNSVMEFYADVNLAKWEPKFLRNKLGFRWQNYFLRF